MEHRYGGRVVLILVVLLIGLIGIFPPQRLFNPELPWSRKINLKPGIDIAGGTSLLYEIDVPPGEVASGELVQNVATALKKRVDPRGVLNLVWRPQPPNRLEIQMPLSGDPAKARQVREAFAAAREELESTNIRLSQVDAALSADPATRDKTLESLAAGVPARRALFRQLLEQTERLRAARKSGDIAAQADAEDAIARIRREIDQTNIPIAQIQSQLELLEAAVEKAERDGGEKAAAPRRQELERRLAQIRQQYGDSPSRAAAVENFIAAFRAFNQLKGMPGDAEDLKRLLRGSGVLEFHILVTDLDSPQAREMIERLEKQGPAPRPGDVMRWYEVDNPEEFKGHAVRTFADKQWVLAWTTPEKSMVHTKDSRPWGLRRAYKGYGPSGMPVVEFEFDEQGAALFGQLTRAHINQPLAIMLDDKVISAPNINTAIEGGRGYIEGGGGGFSEQELRYLVSTLSAGSLPAKLSEEPVSERTVGPQLGHDNLMAGFWSCVAGLLVTAFFMIGYYYFSGVVATFAVVMNMVMILGIMALFNATLTLPGIAGIILTVGMAVDANVLIFERLREEQLRGLSIRMALRNAYDRAWSAILDSNVTTAITSIVLYWLGSEEVKGFGLTLLIGILSSMFTALFVTKTVFIIAIEKFNVRKLGSLPLTFPQWDQMLRPHIDWMGKAWIFIACSAVLTFAGLAAYFAKGREMYDIEFVSGTAVQFELKEKMPIDQVRKLLEFNDPTHPLRSVQVVAVGTGADAGTEYEIITPNDNTPQVRKAVLDALEPYLKIEVPAEFEGSQLPFERALDQVVLPVKDSTFFVPGLAGDRYAPVEAAGHIGGVAVVLRNLDPPLSANEIRARLNRARLQPDRVAQPYHRFEVVSPLKSDQPSRLVVLFSSDEGISYFRDEVRWRQELAAELWSLVVDAVSKPPALQKVTSFSPQVAQATMLWAVTALLVAFVGIMIYMWLRFGNFKYGSAAIIALLHDSAITVGAIGLSHYLAYTWLGDALLIEPFRMNLTLVAAVLTVMGYSVNDTIVIFDRIRENRGKFGHVSRQIINDSVNQTLSRTLLTGGTTMVTLLVMYIWGGAGIHAFTFALLGGIVVGTYSSIAIAAPILLIGGKAPEAARSRPAAGQLQSIGG